MIIRALRLVLAVIPTVLLLSAGATALPLGHDRVANQQNLSAAAAAPLDNAAGAAVLVAQKCRRNEVWQCNKTTREMQAIGWPATYCSCTSAQDDAATRPRPACRSEPGCPCVNGKQVCH
ncbi:MAG: hypothetical protein ABIL01_35620 [Pseudomonadota bacterium]